MHNLAIALHKKGNQVTGSDDEIFEPSRSRLDSYGLLPEKWGWDPGKITDKIECVILGMHARDDNPELIKAREMKIKIYSFPEFLYEQTRNKKRIVIAGSHGKTTITSMIMHSLRANKFKFDYMVGSVLEGFDTMVELDDSNEIAVFEGDEYLTSALDKRPKFHLYQPHISLISGIAWDHINVFPTLNEYIEQFRIFAGLSSEALVYYEEDPLVTAIAEENRNRLDLYPYREMISCVNDQMSMVTFKNLSVSLNIFGRHNMQNLAGAMQVCKLLGIPETDFLRSMNGFTGAARRQELLAENEHCKVYLDFAHAPSKVKATTEAFKEQFPDKQLFACLELHTFSSLNANYLPQYFQSLDKSDHAIVFFNPEVVAHKRLPEISPEQVRNAFGKKNLKVINDRNQVESELLKQKQKNQVLLIMTSGDFSGLNLRQLAENYALACSKTS